MGENVYRPATPSRNHIIEYKIYYKGQITIVVDTPRLFVQVIDGCAQRI
jgi:hypothetical protein